MRHVGADGSARQIPALREPDTVLTSICGFCSTGCALDVHCRAEIHSDESMPVNVIPNATYPVNSGSACPKGWEAMAPMLSDERATKPWVRRGSRRVVVDWSEAFQEFCDRVRAVQDRHGADAVAFLSTGQIVTEEMALLGALAKFGLGMVHGDGNTRQCMATAVAAYKECFGFDAPPYTYADLEESDVVVLVGSNLAIAHPILFERLQRNPHRPEIIVVDPRRTETAMFATQHLALKPKSDQVLLYGIARELIARRCIDVEFIDAHTDGFDDFAAAVEPFDRDHVLASTGLSVEEFERALESISSGERVSFWWTMGVNQGHDATRTAQAIIALALMTGSIGRPGTGANSITGQCNAMGSRLFSNTSSLFCGRDTTIPAEREEVAEILGIDSALIPDRPSLAYDQIVEGVARGEIKGLWVIATNPAHSWINHGHMHDMLERLDLLVVQDLYDDTETASRADLFLPAAGWAEKNGTFINSERRIARVRATRRPPGQARSDFEIFKGIAEHWGCGPLLRRWRNPESVFGILSQLSRGTPCDFGALSCYDDLGDAGVQWPWSDSDAVDAAQYSDERRLFADGLFHTPNGRARFVAETPRPPHDRADDRYPLVLITGRGSTAQWHTQTRTARSAVLTGLSPSALHLEISPADAAERRVESGDPVEIQTRRGTITALAFVSASVRQGQVFLPMHDHTVNRITAPGFDPYSRQPAYKHSAVQVMKSK